MKVKYHCYVVIIDKCDKMPAYLYLAKQLSVIVLFIHQKYTALYPSHAPQCHRQC